MFNTIITTVALAVTSPPMAISPERLWSGQTLTISSI
jgi:hypothetical protein